MRRLRWRPGERSLTALASLSVTPPRMGVGSACSVRCIACFPCFETLRRQTDRGPWGQAVMACARLLPAGSGLHAAVSWPRGHLVRLMPLPLERGLQSSETHLLLPGRRRSQGSLWKRSRIHQFNAEMEDTLLVRTGRRAQSADPRRGPRRGLGRPLGRSHAPLPAGAPAEAQVQSGARGAE